MSADGIFWFEELEQGHGSLVGKKAANLGEMTRMGLPVPPGFAISIDSYKQFAEKTGIGNEITSYFASLGDLKSREIGVFDEASRHIRNIIESRPLPDKLKAHIASYYEHLCRKTGKQELPVSVRSSGRESRPGMFDTYLNIVGAAAVLENVKKVWASVFSTRAIAFRTNKDLPVTGEEIGVAIVKMVNARASGIAFGADSVSGDTSKVIIDAGWGLGEAMVGGAVSGDKFVVSKESLSIVETTIGDKAKLVSSQKHGVDWQDVPPEKRNIPCLSADEILAITKLAKLLEERLGSPQDIEWAIEAESASASGLFLLQTRPVKMPAKPQSSVTDRMVDLIAKAFYKPAS